jgi:hypothetical protein
MIGRIGNVEKAGRVEGEKKRDGAHPHSITPS